MKSHPYIIGLFLFFSGSPTVLAQSHLVAFGARESIHSIMMNPGFQPTDHQVLFGFPTLASQSIDIKSSIRPDDLITQRIDGKKYLDVTASLANFPENTILGLENRSHLLFAGFRLSPKEYLSFGVFHQTTLQGQFSKDFLTFLGKGNGAFVNQEVTFQDEKFYLMQYFGGHFGYNIDLTKKFTLGARINYLAGLGYMELKTWNARIFTDENSVPAYQIDATIAMELVAGGGYAVGLDTTQDQSLSVGDFFQSSSTFGLDLGFTHQINDKFSIQGAVLNISQPFRWKGSYGRSIEIAGDGTFSFDGFETNLGDEDQDFETQFDELEAELERSFDTKNQRKEVSAQAGMGWLGAMSYVPGNGKHQFTAIYHGRRLSEITDHEAGLVYHFTPGKWIQLSGSYSWHQHTPIGLGAGFTVTGGPVQFHFFTNDIVSLVAPDQARFISVRTGLNFVFGKKNKDQKVEEKVPSGTEKYF